MIAIDLPFRKYIGLNGSPLDGGYIYLGLPNQNPETAPVTAYWDEAGTQPALQPVRTVNGLIMHNGAIASLFVAGDYSITIRDRDGTLVCYAPTPFDFQASAILRSDLASPTGATLIGAAGGLTVQTALNAKAALAGLLSQVFRVANAVGPNDAVPLGQADTRYMAIAAGLNFSDVAPINISTVHTNSVAGEFLYINAAGPTTQTFPVANTMAKGRAVAFQNYGAGTATFTRQGTDTLFGVAGGVSVALNQGDTIIAVPDAGGTLFCHVVRAVGASAGPTMTLFTASGTYTKSAGLKALKVRMVGGGASGNASVFGGGGGYSEKFIQASAIAATVTVTVGGGSAAGTNNGGTSSFGAFCSATGGGYTGSGGSGSGGDINIVGGVSSSSAAGNSMLSTPNAPSSASKLYGGGGGAATGMDGAPGIVIIEEYY